jgi:DNA-binding CsgD family transcriptional regulator
MLAARGGDEEARALHLALGTDVPDAAVAAELDAGAAHAAARGAAATAAQLSEAAARLTPDREHADRRLIAAAEHQLAAGDQAAGRALLTGVIERAAPGPVRAAALSMLSWLGPDGSDLATAARLGDDALAEAGDDERLKTTILLRLAVIEEIRGRADVSLRHRRAAVGLAEAGGDAALLANALAALGHSRLLAGDGVSVEARRAVEIERSLPRFLGAYAPSIALGQGLLYSDRFDEARGVLRDVFERATGAGHEEARAAILFHLADLERRAGNWRDAVPLSDRARTLYRQAGNEQEYASCLVVGALLDAGMGRVEEARRDARAGLAAAERIGDETFRIHHLAILGFVELSLGDAAEAARWLGPATDLLRRRGTAELSIYPAVHNEIDALAALGRVDRAEELVGWLERLATATGRTWTAAMAARGRAAILAAGGDVEAALASAQLAADYDAQPFEHARTLLLLGALERRARRKRRSREALERAAAIFAALPAPLWTARAVAELARLGTRADPGALTETEARIAELAATGMTNPEIAATVFVSRKTVEANLSRVYAKLGVRSRVELARSLPRRR